MMSPVTDALEVLAVQDGRDIAFVAPILGFERLTRFALVELEPDSPLFTLQSLEERDTSLLVIATEAVFEDYSPGFDAVSRAAVGLEADEAGLVLAVVNGGASLEEATVNLLAPILLNARTGAAAQVVLTGSEYPLRLPLLG